MEEGEILGEFPTEHSEAKSSFLAYQEGRNGRVVGKSKVNVYTGLEWAMREISKEVANLAVHQ